MGEEHFKTFSGYHCEHMGLGVYPMVDLPVAAVQAFNCPTLGGSEMGASTIAGVAMRSGSDNVVIIGSDVRYPEK